jgi:Asp-tRNA(Asn)/Glu-tRNA(Gln) amidotransferase B subunit
MNYDNYLNLSFEEQLKILIESNMISGKGSKEILDYKIIYPNKNPYEIANNIGLLFMEGDIFKEYQSAQKFKELYSKEINEYIDGKLQDKEKGKLIGLLMKYYKGSLNPNTLDEYINNYLIPH